MDNLFVKKIKKSIKYTRPKILSFVYLVSLVTFAGLKETSL